MKWIKYGWFAMIAVLISISAVFAVHDEDKGPEKFGVMNSRNKTSRRQQMNVMPVARRALNSCRQSETMNRIWHSSRMRNQKLPRSWKGVSA